MVRQLRHDLEDTRKPKIICNTPYMTKNLTKVSKAYLEPSQTPMRELFCENS